MRFVIPLQEVKSRPSAKLSRALGHVHPDTEPAPYCQVTSQQFGCGSMNHIRAASEASRVAHGLRDSFEKVTRDFRIGVNKGQNIAAGSVRSGVSNPCNIVNGLVYDHCAE